VKTIFYILSIILLASISGRSQALVITDSATTPSICFNDGTITMSASGGTRPYTFTIIGGPSYPNITYPITIPTLDSVFQTLPKGEYTIKVTDGSGNTAFATATVGGTYTFPVINPAPPDTVYSGCITVAVQGGRPPYQYARSSVGTNSGFGAYQSSGTFCNLCNGPYWIRVKDSCQNIFTTNKITVIVPIPTYNVTYTTVGDSDHIHVNLITSGAPPYTFHLSSGSISLTNQTGVFVIPVQCPPDVITATDSCGRIWQTTINIHQLNATALGSCTSGNAFISIDSSAIGPFTITGSNPSTIVTHQHQVSITGLPLHVAYNFTVTDSCGNTQSFILPCDSTISDTIFFYNVCPFDSSIHMTQDPVQFCYPVVVTCLNCSPVQIDTIFTTPARLFTGIDTGVLYRVRIQDQCGFDYTTVDVPQFIHLPIADSVLTCSDFSVFSFPAVFTPPVTYTVFDQLTLVDSMTANFPIFYHLPPATYQVKATQPLCLANAITVTLPALGGACIMPMLDSTCMKAYAIYENAVDYTEVYSLVSTVSGTSYIQTLPSPYADALLFYDVPPGNYNLVSDSGCSFPFVLPPFPQYVLSATATHQCTGTSLIQADCTPPISACNTSQGPYYVLLKNNQYIASSVNGRFTVLDTGYYVIRLFLSNTQIFSYNVRYDTICPIDTMLIYVGANIVPNIVSTQVEVCGDSARGNIPYTIFGGTAPYTVQILGYPTQTDSFATDTFPDVRPGIYTMIVSDYCGISRSFSVSVVDTCSSICTTKSAFTINGSSFCSDALVTMTNQSTSATHYKWDINGSLYAYVADTTFYASVPGSYTITLYAYVGVCVDSSSQTFVIQDTILNTAKTDTTLCSPFSLRLNTHIANTVWSSGPSDSAYTVTASGLYIATVTNACGSNLDSVKVNTYPEISGLNLTDSKDALCEGVTDSVMITASIDSSGQQSVTFRWNTGTVDSDAYSSQIIVYQAGPYQVTALNGFCPVSQSITIDTVSCDSECIAGIAIPDIFSPNSDGKNDTFYILHICDINPFEMHIYNRWGELVFESPDIHKGWDGKYKGTPEPEEVYWLWLMLTLPDGKTIYRSGYVTLVR